MGENNTSGTINDYAETRFIETAGHVLRHRLELQIREQEIAYLAWRPEALLIVRDKWLRRLLRLNRKGTCSDPRVLLASSFTRAATCRYTGKPSAINLEIVLRRDLKSSRGRKDRFHWHERHPQMVRDYLLQGKG